MPMSMALWQSPVCADGSSMDVVVQPSVPWMTLNDKIKSSGLFFPVDPGPSVSARLGSNALRKDTWLMNFSPVIISAVVSKYA
jgi:D-lactate dehydrogenase (cytochrome)